MTALPILQDIVFSVQDSYLVLNLSSMETASNALLKLGKDGKLMPQEHQRRVDNKLCLFCGTAGHIVKDCTKAASSKAQTVKTKQENSESSTLASKKD